MTDSALAFKNAANHPYLKGGERYASWINVKVSSVSSTYTSPYSGGSKITGTIQYVDPKKNDAEQLKLFPDGRSVEIMTNIPTDQIMKGAIIRFDTLVMKTTSMWQSLEAYDPRPPEAVFGRDEHNKRCMEATQRAARSSGGHKPG